MSSLKSSKNIFLQKNQRSKIRAKALIKRIIKIFGINRMTAKRWREDGKISSCYKELLSKVKKYPGRIPSQKDNILEIKEAFRGLEEQKRALGSWQKVEDQFGIDKRTMRRWRKSGTISPGYRMLLFHLFKEHHI